MQRTDKIGLIVASALVVLLCAGGAFLLYARSTTLATERPLDTGVKLVSLGDAAAPATVAPAAAAKPVVPKKPKGADFGYITKVSGSGTGLALRWDQAELLTGSEADLYAKKKGAVVNTKLYIIANDTHTTKVYRISPTAQIQLTSAEGSATTLSAPEFGKRWSAGGAIRTATWWLYAHGESVYQLQQVTLPSPDAQ